MKRRDLVKWMGAAMAPAGAAGQGPGRQSGTGGAASPCEVCGKVHAEPEVLACPMCGRRFQRGESQLAGGDDYCSNKCAFDLLFPDEGSVYVRGQVNEDFSSQMWSGGKSAPTKAWSRTISCAPLRKTHHDVKRAKIIGLEYRKTKLPANYPIPYPDPIVPDLPIPGHPIPLEALYKRESEVRRRSGSVMPPPEEAASSQWLAYQTAHESRAFVFRLNRASNIRQNMVYPRYPWNDDGTLCVPPYREPMLGYAGDGSAIPAGAALRMTRHYRYLKEQTANLHCDVRVPLFLVRDGETVHSYEGPQFGPEVIEAGMSHGEYGWTPAPRARDAVYYWAVSLDPFKVGNLGGAVYYVDKKPIYCLGMQGWLIRPGKPEPARKFYEGPYISHESLAYYHGPADRYAGFDRNRIAMLVWWGPPKLREYRVYDGDGKLIRTLATNSDRVHMVWAGHGNYIIGDSSYDQKYPGTMTVFFPDSGAIRPIGFHDNSYYGSVASEHPHPATSPDGTKVLYKATHMSALHGLEIMVVRPPYAPVLSRDGDRLRWHVPGVNTEILSYRIFRSAESGRGYRFIEEVRDPRTAREKLSEDGAPYALFWQPPAGMKGYFVVCSVEGSGLMSPPSNEISAGGAGTRRIFVRVEDLIEGRVTAYITPDGEAASWAVVRQTEVELRLGETPAGDPRIAWEQPGPGPYEVYVRLRGKGRVSFGSLGELRADSEDYVWRKLGPVAAGKVRCTVRIDEGVRIDQLCFSADAEFRPAGKGPLSLTPAAPGSLRAAKIKEGVVELAWTPPPEAFVKEYHVYGVTGDGEPSQRWRLCTVKEPKALDWNLPSGETRYYVSAVGWDLSESKLRGPARL